MTNGWRARDIQPPWIIHYGISVGESDAAVRQLKEAGVNIVQINDFFDGSDAQRTNICQIAQKYQMGLFPWGIIDPAQREAFVRKWSQDPAVFGWFQHDELSRDGEWGYSGAAFQELLRRLYNEMKEWSGGLTMGSVHDDPLWGANIGPGMDDILGYEAQYPFEKSVSDPYARTTNLTKLRGYGGGPLQRAHEAGMIVIPVLQAFRWGGNDELSQPIPDPSGQWDAYQRGFPAGEFDKGAWLYDPAQPVKAVVGIPELKARVQQLVVKLGGTVAPPPIYTCPTCGATFPSQAELDAHIATEHPIPGLVEDIACPGCASVLRVHYK